MKRSAIKRKVGLKRCVEPGCRKAVFSKKSCSSMKPLSKSRAALNRIYLRDRKPYLEANPRCVIQAVGCRLFSACIHHKKGRVGLLLIDQRFWAASCHYCNIWLESAKGKVWGKKHGFRLDRLGNQERLE